jgi:predicted phage terminase large subunit-like protein
VRAAEWAGRVEKLQRRERERVSRWLSPRLTRYVPHVPTPKQAAFLLIDQRESMYGGSAGGGKSDALLMAALQYADVPGYAALLLRRTYPDLALPGALMDRAAEWLTGTDARWDNDNKTWHFPSGATLTFGYLEYEKHKFRYQSAEFQFVGFDELTQFPESQYRYLFSRLRRLEGSEVPVRMRAASNPGGVGHEWVKRRFIDEGRARGRPFVRAWLRDNPHLDQAEYIQSLSQLDPLTRQQLLDGDWTARVAGGRFRREWFRVLDAPPARLVAVVRYWDTAATEETEGQDPDWTVGTKMGRTPEGQFPVLDVRRLRGTPGAVDEAMKQTAALDGRDCPVRIEEEPGASGKTATAHYVKLLAGYDVRGDRPTGPKQTRWNPLSAQAEAGNVPIVRGAWCGDWLDELEAVPEGAHDDQADSGAGALKFLTSDREYETAIEIPGRDDTRASPWRI